VYRQLKNLVLELGERFEETACTIKTHVEDAQKLRELVEEKEKLCKQLEEQLASDRQAVREVGSVRHPRAKSLPTETNQRFANFGDFS
jgi:hypothetical protein